MEKKELTQQAIIDYTNAEEVNLELGLISLTSVTEAEQLLMLRAAQKDRLVEMTTAIGVSYLNQETTLNAEERHDLDLLQRIDCLVTGRPYIKNSDTSHLISIWDFKEYLKSANLTTGEASRFRGSLLRSSIHITMMSRPFLKDLVVFKDDEMPHDMPLEQRRFIDMNVLEGAYDNGEFGKAYGISTVRLQQTADFIDYWKRITGRKVRPV